MAEIVLCRVDSRLVHGQVMTKWVRQADANEIIIVSDILPDLSLEYLATHNQP